MITILQSVLGLSIFRLGKIGGWNAQIATVMVPTAIRQMPQLRHGTRANTKRDHGGSLTVYFSPKHWDETVIVAFGTSSQLGVVSS
jgi:hypothetical protein